MAKMTNAELAILSLVVERPRHGYEIEQVIEERGMREWTEVGFSSIYYLLKKLEREGLVEGRLEQVGRGAARKVYQATPAGRQAWRDGVLETLSVPQRCYPPLQLGLSNLPAIPPAEAVAALQKYHAALTDRQTHVHTGWESQKPLPYFIDAMFDYSLALIEAELNWIEKFITRVEEQYDQD
jgi:DNA-binding PadR family transcriptional regulator